MLLSVGDFYENKRRVGRLFRDVSEITYVLRLYGESR